MENTNSKYTPLPPNINLNNTQPIPIPTSHIKFMQDKDYQKATGMLNYVCQWNVTRHIIYSQYANVLQ
jgi:hypothetical protein